MVAKTAPQRVPSANRQGTGLRNVVRSARNQAARHVWAVLLAETCCAAVAHLASAGRSWHFFRTGAQLLTNPSAVGGGLHLYHFHPQLQIGPLTFLAAWPAAALPAGPGRVVALCAMSAFGLLVLRVLTMAVPGPAAERHRAILVPGLLFVPVWGELAVRFGHLDDVLALLLGTAALAAARRRPHLTALLLALAASCKPWAVGLAPSLLITPRRRRGTVFVVWAVATAAPWVPFLIADPSTLEVGRFSIPNAADSALRALGIHDPSTPWWCQRRASQAQHRRRRARSPARKSKRRAAHVRRRPHAAGSRHLRVLHRGTAHRLGRR